MAAMFAGLQVVTEAELAIRGIWPVSVVHGDAETAEDADLIYGALHRLAGECGQLAGYRGGKTTRRSCSPGPTPRPPPRGSSPGHRQWSTPDGGTSPPRRTRSGTEGRTSIMSAAAAEQQAREHGSRIITAL